MSSSNVDDNVVILSDSVRKNKTCHLLPGELAEFESVDKAKICKLGSCFIGRLMRCIAHFMQYLLKAEMLIYSNSGMNVGRNHIHTGAR